MDRKTAVTSSRAAKLVASARRLIAENEALARSSHGPGDDWRDLWDRDDPENFEAVADLRTWCDATAIGLEPCAACGGSGRAHDASVCGVTDGAELHQADRCVSDCADCAGGRICGACRQVVHGADCESKYHNDDPEMCDCAPAAETP